MIDLQAEACGASRGNVENIRVVLYVNQVDQGTMVTHNFKMIADMHSRIEHLELIGKVYG